MYCWIKGPYGYGLQIYLSSYIVGAHIKIYVCRFIPFSGGPRKCVGDQFALLEAIVSLAIFLQHLSFELVPDQVINMTTGATIHTTNVIFSVIDNFNFNCTLMRNTHV